ncbi:MAG: DUF2304 domain-containing protein [Bacillota bacterium]|nr:DUF2304 domain-containing protein [Bacillota bacterium]
MHFDIYTGAVIIGLLFLLVVLRLVRNGNLQERYALLWLFAALVIIVLALGPSLLDRLAGILKIYYPPSLLFFVAIMFCFVLLLHFSVVLSQLSRRVVRLTQEVALLRYELREEKGGEQEDVG